MSVTWIRHNLDAAEGRRFVLLRLAGGYEAHGIFWALVPHLYKYGNKYPLANAKQKLALASQLHITVEQLEKFVQQCVESEKLLEIVDGCLTCDRISEELEYRAGLSKKRIIAGRKGGKANAKQKQASALTARKQNQAQDNTRQNNTIHNKTRFNGALSSADFVFPENLNSQACRDALDDFIRHRSEKKKPVTRTQIEKVLKKYALQPDDFIPNLEHSIANGWQGIHPPNGAKTKETAAEKALRIGRELTEQGL